VASERELQSERYQDLRQSSLALIWIKQVEVGAQGYCWIGGQRLLGGAGDFF
jgi:hypothetical protein